MKKSKSFQLRQYFYENDFNSVDEKVLTGILNSLISPVFEEKGQINIVFRLNDSSLIKNHFKKNIIPRLKFLDVKSYDLIDENFEDTCFIVVSSKQYNFVLMFDFLLSNNDNEALFYSSVNSKNTDEILKIILPDEKFFPERRENKQLNQAIHNLIKLNKNSITEFNINEAEKNNLEIITQNLKRDEFLARKSRYISHEIKNHLSIIDVYTKIIEKNAENNTKIKNSADTIYSSIKKITKLLLELKNVNEADLNVYDLKNTVSEVVQTASELAKNNNINLSAEIENNITVILDKDKFQNVILNLIKNAVEALNTEQKEKYIRLSAKAFDNGISLYIENNGEKIEKDIQEKIFEEGFTTKSTGSGLGLFICKQSLKEQLCELSLLKSTSAITVFEIKINTVG